MHMNGIQFLYASTFLSTAYALNSWDTPGCISCVNKDKMQHSVGNSIFLDNIFSAYEINFTLVLC